MLMLMAATAKVIVRSVFFIVVMFYVFGYGDCVVNLTAKLCGFCSAPKKK